MRLTVNGRNTVFLDGRRVDQPDVPRDTQGTVRTPDGRETSVDSGGTYVSHVLAIAGFPKGVVRALAVQRAGTSEYLNLSGDEVRDGFPGGRKATVYTGYGHGVSFFRPLRGDDDSNSADSFQTSIDRDLVMALTTTSDEIRVVIARADDTQLDPGESTGFTTRVEDPPGEVSFTYNWDFGDGRTTTGQAPSHAFAAGRYSVTVTAVGDDGSTGISEPIDVQVGKPSETATPAPTATSPPAQQTGPENQPAPPGGGDAPEDEGVVSGPKQSDGRGDGPQSPRPRATAAPSATAGPTAATTVATTNSPAPTPERARTTPTATATPASAATRAPGRQVDGVLLAGAGSPTELAQVLETVPAAEARAPARRGGGGGGSPWGWAGGGGLLVLLLAGGAAAELRGLRR